MRVYSSLLILKEIMETIIRCEKSYLDEPIEPAGPAESSHDPLIPHKADIGLPCHYFDYIGGTGSGGLIAIMLGRLKMNVDDSILASEALLKEVFYHKRWFHYRSLLFWPRAKFDHQILEQAIQNLVGHHAPGAPSFFGSSGFAFDENQCRTIVLAFRRNKDSKGRKETPYLFRTYNKYSFPSTDQGHNQIFVPMVSAHHIPIWQVARATTASPTFFRPIDCYERSYMGGYEYVSGGFGIKNPCEKIYHEVQDMVGIDNVDIILSIGTGKPRISSRSTFLGLYPSLALQRIPEKITSTRDYHRLDVEILGQLRMDKWQAGGHVRTNIVSLMGRHRSKTKAAAPGQRSQTVLANPDNSSVPIIRSAKSKMAEWFHPRNVTEESIRKHTRDYLDRVDVQHEINKIATSLVQKRRNRVKRDLERWERFCFETWYQCKVPGCPNSQNKDRYDSRSALQTHILERHSDKYSRRDREALEAALDEGRIRLSKT